MGADDVGDPAQVTAAFAGRTLLPALLSSKGCLDSLVHLLYSRALDAGNRLPGGRVLDDELMFIGSR